MAESEMLNPFLSTTEKPKTISRREQFRLDAELILNNARRNKLDLTSFINDDLEGFSAKDISRDLETVSRMKETFRQELEDLPPEAFGSLQERRKKSDALETVIIDGGQDFRWFSEYARVIHTSEFDDIFNGVDAVLEFAAAEGKTPQRIALAIDASLGSDQQVVEKKISRGLEKISKGKMQVKYFQSQLDEFKGKLTTVLPIVLGLEGHSSEKLIHLFAEIIRLQKDQSSEQALAEKIMEAKQHPAIIIFLKEMHTQLQMYAIKFGREESFIKYEIENILAIVEGLLQEKKDIEIGDYEQDRAYKTIVQVCMEKTL